MHISELHKLKEQKKMCWSHTKIMAHRCEKERFFFRLSWERDIVESKLNKRDSS